MGVSVIFAAAALWGFAEATLFFVIPDVLLTFVAVVYGLRGAALACLWTALGAVAGGAVMYVWAAQDAEAARAAIEAVPVVSADLVREVQGDLAARGPLALALGGVTGVPYKIFAVAAPAAGMSWPLFLTVSFGARLARFLLLSAAAWGFDRQVLRRYSLRVRLGILAGVWVVLYLGFFALAPG